MFDVTCVCLLFTRAQRLRMGRPHTPRVVLRLKVLPSSFCPLVPPPSAGFPACLTHKVTQASLFDILAGFVSNIETLGPLQVQQWSRQAAEDAAPHAGVGNTSAGSDSEQEWPQVHRWSWQAERGLGMNRRGVGGSGTELEWPHEAGQGLQREGSEQVRLGVGVSVACCSLLQTAQGEPASPHVGQSHCRDGPWHEPGIAGMLATSVAELSIRVCCSIRQASHPAVPCSLASNAWCAPS